MRVVLLVSTLAVAAVVAPRGFILAQQGPKGIRLADINWQQATDVLRPETVVVIPLGAGSKEHGPHLKLGNDAVRDYLHVDDVVQAYLRLLERGTPGEAYNVASGRGVSVRQLASDVLLRVGATADISTDVALQRATDIPTLVGSPVKLTKDTGWTPQRTHLDIIDDVIRFASAHAATD